MERDAGEWSATPALVTELREGEALVGRLALGPRRDGRRYGPDEVRELEATAAVVAHSVALAAAAEVRSSSAP